MEHHQKALEIDREIGYQQGQANQLGNIGVVYKTQKDYKNAIECYLKSAFVFEKLQSPDVRKIRNNLNVIKQKIGETQFNEYLKQIKPEM